MKAMEKKLAISFDNLPNEIIMRVFDFLDEDIKTLTSLQLVSKKFSRLVNHAMLHNLKRFAGANLRSLITATWLKNLDNDWRVFFQTTANERLLNFLPQEGTKDERELPLAQRAKQLGQRAQVAHYLKKQLIGRKKLTSSKKVNNLFLKCLQQGDEVRKAMWRWMWWPSSYEEGADREKIQGQLKALMAIGIHPNLYTLAKNSEQKNISACIEAGADINVRSKSGNTLLHRAVKKYQVQFIQNILSLGADVHARNKHGNTPLHIAASVEENHAVVSKLLDGGASINAQGRFGTPLHHAVLHDVNDGNTGVVLELLNRGAEINAKNDLGRTPLHFAASRDNDQDNIVTIFLERGADVNLADERRRTPLHTAALAGHATIVSMLARKAGHGIRARDENGQTPLHIATRLPHRSEAALALIDANAPVMFEDKDGESPFTIARDNSNPTVLVKMLSL